MPLSSLGEVLSLKKKKKSYKCELHQTPRFFGEMQKAYFPRDCTSMVLDLLDPVLLCAQFIICDLLIGFLHRCLLGAFCTSWSRNRKYELRALHQEQYIRRIA